MTSAERAQALVAARFLRAAERSDWFSIALTLLALFAIVTGSVMLIASIVAALGLIARYYALRISFDARLLEDITSDNLATADLDTALSTIGFVKPEKTGRAWPDRCRGAKRLVLFYELTVAAQVACVIVAAVALVMNR